LTDVSAGQGFLCVGTAGFEPTTLDPQQRQATWLALAIMYLRCLRCWWALVCMGRDGRQSARSYPRFLPALGNRGRKRTGYDEARLTCSRCSRARNRLSHTSGRRHVPPSLDRLPYSTSNRGTRWTGVRMCRDGSRYGRVQVVTAPMMAPVDKLLLPTLSFALLVWLPGLRCAGFPVAQACPDRAAPPGSRWSATPAERPGPGRRGLVASGAPSASRQGSPERRGPGQVALAAGGEIRVVGAGGPTRRRHPVL
jgi:hypothetical protein